MREPLCICCDSLTSGIVSRAAVVVATEGAAVGAGEGAAVGPVIPVPAPAFVAVGVVVGVAVGAAFVGLLTLLPISKDAEEKKR
jgi:hypothetical protein